MAQDSSAPSQVAPGGHRVGRPGENPGLQDWSGQDRSDQKARGRFCTRRTSRRPSSAPAHCPDLNCHGGEKAQTKPNTAAVFPEGGRGPCQSGFQSVLRFRPLPASAQHTQCPSRCPSSRNLVSALDSHNRPRVAGASMMQATGQSQGEPTLTLHRWPCLIRSLSRDGDSDLPNPEGTFFNSKDITTWRATGQ